MLKEKEDQGYFKYMIDSDNEYKYIIKIKYLNNFINIKYIL